MTIKNQKGAVLVFVLLVISLITSIGFFSYNKIANQSLIIDKVRIKSETFLLAENAISSVLNIFEQNTNSIISQLPNSSNKKIIRCYKDDNYVEQTLNESSINYNCHDFYEYKNKDFIIQTKTSKENSLCLSWGNSDKSVQCYQIEGYSRYVPTNIKSENIQEVQIISIKTQDVGIYEF